MMFKIKLALLSTILVGITLAVEVDVMHDVGVTDIIKPVGKIMVGTKINPSVTVENFGTEDETFNVTFTFKGYGDTKEVADLAPGMAATVDFDGILMDKPSDYSATAYVQLAWDENAANNEMKDSFQIVNKIHDVGIEAIVMPVGEIAQGMKLTPSIMVKNYGNQTDTFNVGFTFKGYSSTKKVNGLAPGQTATVNFNNWTANKTGKDTGTAFTQLNNDDNPANNTMRIPFQVIKRKHDVGVMAILVPVGQLPEEMIITPTAKVKNFGTEPETFTVTFELQGYTDTKKITGLDPGKTATLNFASWTAKDIGDYEAIVYTKLTRDEDPTNNAMRGRFAVRTP